MNMPGPNREVYATATLFICIFTTVVCGGLTECMLTRFDMKVPDESAGEGDMQLNRLSFRPSRKGRSRDYPIMRRTRQRVYHGTKRLLEQIDNDLLIPYFGGPDTARASLGKYELSRMYDDDEMG